jgi:thiol-disulfide isomerase/thioredoxin
MTTRLALRPLRLPLLLAMLAGLCGLLLPADARQPAAPPAAEAEGPAAAIELPADGSPEELLEFAERLRKPKARPRSQEELMKYMGDVARVSVQAADKVLPKLKPNDPLFARAASLKLDGLMMLGRLGDEKAQTEMAAFAGTLVDCPVPDVAMEAKRLLIVADAQQMFEKSDFAAAPALVKKMADLLAQNPDDTKSVGLAMQLAQAFEQIPEGDQVAAAAFKSFAPILQSSKNQQVKELAEGFASKLRLLELPGKPMEIKGALLDGSSFDQKGLAGKVVLVDFWATWCGPCVAEIPNMLEQYEKYHAKGFEVVGISLDEDRKAVEGFVAENKIPWPIIFAGKGWQDPLAQFYGISGIPQLILIGKDGNVITLNARGKKLAEKLAELFKDAG